MDPKWKYTEKFILLPELNLLTHYRSDKFRTHYKCANELSLKSALAARLNRTQFTIEDGSIFKINLNAEVAFICES